MTCHPDLARILQKRNGVIIHTALQKILAALTRPDRHPVACEPHSLLARTKHERLSEHWELRPHDEQAPHAQCRATTVTPLWVKLLYQKVRAVARHIARMQPVLHLCTSMIERQRGLVRNHNAVPSRTGVSAASTTK
jgi:hypothetical protein